MKEQNDKIEQFFNKVDKLTFKAVKIMLIFIPLYLLFHIFAACENEQTIVCECTNGSLIIEDVINPDINECDRLCNN